MGETLRSRRPGHAHEQHLVLVRQCDCCGRWVVLRGSADHVAGFSDQGEARAAARELLGAMEGRPDPDPISIEITRPGHAVATGLPPVEPSESLTAA